MRSNGSWRNSTPEALASAIALYRGPLLGGFAIHASVFEGWLQVQRDRLTEAALLAFRQASRRS